MVKCSELFGKKEFESYSEFYLALCYAMEMQTRGERFDMSDMRIEPGILPKEELTYYKYLLGEGIIVLGENKEYPKVNVNDVSLYFDIKNFAPVERDLVEDRGETYFWDINWAISKYSSCRVTLLNLTNMGNILMHLVAHLTVKMFYNEIPRKKLVLSFSGSKVKSTYLYVNIFSCCKTLDWFNELVYCDLDLKDLKVDINYSIHCNNGLAAGRYKLWSVQEKKDLLKKCNIVEGSIVVLWKRKGMCPSNTIGRITSAIIARVDEIGSDFIALTEMALNKTKEEVEVDYYGIPEETRYLFSDLLYKKPSVTPRIYKLTEMGVHNYFYNEYMFLTLLDKSARTSKLITVDGETSMVEMSEIDAIYWLLCQYELDFDRELYRKMYSGGKELMWDKYGEEI